MHMSMTVSYNQIILCELLLLFHLNEQNKKKTAPMYSIIAKMAATNKQLIFLIKKYLKNVDTLFCLLKGDKINIS